MDTTLLPTTEVETGPTPTHAVIWMHGLGADGHDFEPIVQEFNARKFPATRFVFPDAPARPVTVNNGYVMRAWYDIVSLDFTEEREDPLGVKESAQQIEALIARENARGVADSHIVLAGFSQGGAVALYTALRHPQRLAGVLALSTYLPLANTLTAEASAANRDVPIFMAHGHSDGVIPYSFGQQSAALMQGQGYSLSWHGYRMEHTVTLEELRDIEDWLATVLV